MITFIWALSLGLMFMTLIRDRNRAVLALKNSLKAFGRIMPWLAMMVLVLGIILALVSEEVLASLFAHEGPLGFAMAALVGAIITVPGPIIYPIVGPLLKMGADQAALATFITTLTMVGLVSAPLESKFFGMRFTAMRQALSFIAAIGIGMLMGVAL